MALSFNGNTKTVTITSDVTLDVKNLWSRWVDWFLSGDNSKYPMAMEQVGGNDIDPTAGTSIPIYIYLSNGWRVKPKESSHVLAVQNGILLTSDSADPFINTSGAFQVRVNYQQPVQAIGVNTGGGGGGGLTQQQVRDAMLLEPTGAADTGSIDEKLGKIKNDTGLIPAAL
jgi:hypothetical protein